MSAGAVSSHVFPRRHQCHIACAHSGTAPAPAATAMRHTPGTDAGNRRDGTSMWHGRQGVRGQGGCTLPGLVGVVDFASREAYKGAIRPP
jgi:hypothetical protein